MVDMSMPANPLYSMSPTTPPGMQGIPYMISPLIAGMTGGVARPYVAPNMATYDATIASQVNNPLYKSMMAAMYAQMGSQLGTFMGDTKFMQGLGTMAGYSPEETKRALEGGLGAFSRSQIGSFVMPVVDSTLNSMGLTGGSFVAATQAAFNGRMNLMGAGTLINPYNAGQQHQAMAAAAATATMLNTIMSQRDKDGKLLPTVDQTLMQGFSRERVAQLAMRAAGMGMFSSNANGGFNGTVDTGTGNLSERLTQAMGDTGVDIYNLSVKNFDGQTDFSQSDSTAVQKVNAIRDEVHRKVQGLTEALGAMRDLTGVVDEELEGLLDNVTNGRWARSAKGAFDARDAVRSLHAVASVYNLDPKAALNQIIANRTVLQDAAGFDGSMLSMGFDGGGMFGLAAQTELLADIEDIVTARGVRGDPILSGRIRRQGLQAMAVNMNSMAGRASQVLAYARQTGVLSDADVKKFTEELSSGDSGIMGTSINRLLTTVFGSAEAGRRFMNDSMQMNSMRMAMDDNAGKFANALTRQGASAEFQRREQITAADQRLAFTQRALAESGLNTWQSAEGANKVVANIVESILGDGKDATRVSDARAFQTQFDTLVAGGADPRSAASRVIDAYKRSPATSAYSQLIDLAVKQQSAINNEGILATKNGLESRQATALVRDLSARGMIDGAKSSELYRMVREGRGSEALASVNGIIRGLDVDTQKQMQRVRESAAEKHEAAIEEMRSNVEATQLIEAAAERGYGGEDVAKAYETMAAAGLRYSLSNRDEDAYSDFWESVSQSKFVSIFGDKALEEYMSVAEWDSAKDAAEYFRKMGKRAGSLRRTAVSTLGNSGYGLQMSGYWGGGISTANSKEARERRDKTIQTIAMKTNEDAIKSAKERDSFATRVADLMMGTKNWKELLKIYDPKGKTGLESAISQYGAAFEEYESAQMAFNNAQRGYNMALKSLASKGAFPIIGYVEDLLKGGGPIHIKTLEKKLSGLDDPEREAILTAARARKRVIETQSAADKVMGDTVADKENVKNLKGFTAWEAVRRQRNEKLMADKRTASYLDDIDWSKEGLEFIERTSGAGKAFLDKMFAAVTDEEVAAKLGIDPSKGIKREYGETAMSIVREKAMHGDEKALSVYKAARAAGRDAATRIHGEITIKSGWDSSPAVLEGNIS